MPNLKGPLFSIAARGTLANTLTYTARRNSPRVGLVPSHPDANSLLQRNHRFLYQLGIAIWNGMSASERAPYVARAVGHHFTAMNAWLNTWLTTTPNLILANPIQLGAGITLADISPLATPATLHGPTWQLTLSRPFILADGVDDYARLPLPADLDLQTPSATLLFRIRPVTLPAQVRIFDKGLSSVTGWGVLAQPTELLQYITYAAAAYHITSSAAGSFPLGEWHTWAIRISIPDVWIYKDGILTGGPPPAQFVPDTSNQRVTYFIAANLTTQPSNLAMSWFAVFDRTLSIAEIRAISNQPSLSLPS